MKLLSVNASLPKQILHNGKIITTGIYKKPVNDRVMVYALNVQGDGQADRKVHGGHDMAVYAYPFEHYKFWEETLERPEFPFGQFGENLTVEGLSEETVRIGDVFRVGSALLQVTQPRIPCYKLALRMGEGADFQKRFQDSGRLGFYLRVIEEGEIGAGDMIERVDTDGRSVTIAEFIHIYLHETHIPDSLRRMLASRNLGDAWRMYLEKMLEKAGPTPGPGGCGKVGDGSSPAFDVVFDQSGVTVAWEPGVDSILELAESHGLRPDYSCRSGICHTCMCKLIAGEVAYVVEPADPPDPGHVLICCTRPVSDVIVGV